MARTPDEDPSLLGHDDADVAHDPVEREHLLQQATAESNMKAAQVKDELRARKLAFTRCFRDGNATLDDVTIVRRVLDKFCRKNRSTFHADARLHALAEGRREVLLYVDDYIELSVDDLFTKLV